MHLLLTSKIGFNLSRPRLSTANPPPEWCLRVDLPLKEDVTVTRRVTNTNFVATKSSRNPSVKWQVLLTS